MELKRLYGEWLVISLEMMRDGYYGSIDCGLESVRKDFSDYAGLDEVISFEEMLKLERGM